MCIYDVYFWYTDHALDSSGGDEVMPSHVSVWSDGLRTVMTLAFLANGLHALLIVGASTRVDTLHCSFLVHGSQRSSPFHSWLDLCLMATSHLRACRSASVM